MQHIARFLAFAALTCLIAGPSGAQPWTGKGRLQGQILDPDGKPFEGAKVSLHPQGEPDQGPEPLTSNKKGRWSYLGLKGGTWIVVIEAEGHLSSEGIVQVTEFGSASKPVQTKLTALSPEMLQNAAIGLVEEGNKLMQAEDFANARAKYEEAMPDLTPENQLVLQRGIARTYQQEENTDQAIAALEKALELSPGDPESLKLMISILLAAGRKDEAEPFIAQLPETEKLDPSTRLNMGIEKYNGGELDAALEHFNQAVADFPDNPDVYYYRGLTYLGQTKNDLALVDLQKMLEIAPDSPKAAEAQQFIEYLQTQ